MKDDDATEELAACDGKAAQRNVDIRNVAHNVVESAGSAATNILDAVNGVARSVPKIGDAAAKIAVKAEDAVAVLNSPEQVQTLLDACYQAALDGIPKVSSSVDTLVNEYRGKSETTAEAARKLISNQLIKCSTSGFLSGVGGALTLSATVAAVSANVGSVIYVQMRMVAALAQMGGYDIHFDQVQTMVYVCLTGKAMSDILKSAGIKTSERLAVNVIKKLPGQSALRLTVVWGCDSLRSSAKRELSTWGKWCRSSEGLWAAESISPQPRRLATTPIECSLLSKSRALPSLYPTLSKQ